MFIKTFVVIIGTIGLSIVGLVPAIYFHFSQWGMKVNDETIIAILIFSPIIGGVTVAVIGLALLGWFSIFSYFVGAQIEIVGFFFSTIERIVSALGRETEAGKSVVLVWIHAILFATFTLLWLIVIVIGKEFWAVVVQNLINAAFAVAGLVISLPLYDAMYRLRAKKSARSKEVWRPVPGACRWGGVRFFKSGRPSVGSLPSTGITGMGPFRVKGGGGW